MRRILLLGANGQVGFELLRSLASLGEVIAATRDGRLADDTPCLCADLSDAASLRAALHEARADVVVNAAAYTAVDRAEDEPELADRINHRAVGEIATWAAARGALLVHYSTDYVFDGRGMQPYREDDATAPLGVYGKSKLAGENALRASGAAHLIFRTAWVYASRGSNFLRTMLRVAVERDELCIVADQIGAPTSARLVAQVTAEVIAGWRAEDATARETAQGTYHLVAEGQCSWFDFANAIMREAVERGVLGRAPSIVPIASAAYPTRAQRPAYSVLDCQRLKRRFGLQLPPWQEGLRVVFEEVAAVKTASFPIKPTA